MHCNNCGTRVISSAVLILTLQVGVARNGNAYPRGVFCAWPLMQCLGENRDASYEAVPSLRVGWLSGCGERPARQRGAGGGGRRAGPAAAGGGARTGGGGRLGPQEGREGEGGGGARSEGRWGGEV